MASPSALRRFRLRGEVAGVVPLLRAGPAALGHALEVLADGLMLEGCCLVELRDQAVIVRGAAGIAPALDERALVALLAAAPVAPTLVPAPEAESASTVVVTVGRPPQALAARGGPVGRPDVQAVLRIVGPLVAWTDAS